MSTPMFRLGAEKKFPTFWQIYTYLGRGDFLQAYSLFSGAVFDVGAALLNAEEKKGISKRGFGGEGLQRGPF